MKFRVRDLSAALVWALAACVLSFLWTVKVAVWTAGWGAFAGYWAGVGLAATRLRVLPTVLGLWLLEVVLSLSTSVWTDATFPAGVLGAQNAYTLGQVLLWFVQTFCGVTCLRFVSGRYPALVSLEVLTVGLMLASPLAAHRQGFISRPYFFVDPLWGQNQDPVPVLFFLGVLCAAILVVLSLGRRTRRAGVLDLLVLITLISLLYLMLPERRVKDLIPEPKGNGMGLKGDPKPAGKGTGGGGKGGSGQSNQQDDEMPLDQPPDQDKKKSPVAVVLLHDDYDPPMGYYYFRQTAFSQFNGKRLVADTTGLADTDLIDHFPTDAMRINAASASNATARDPYHTTLNTTVALVESHQRPFAMVDPVELAPAPNPNPGQFVRAYDVQSLVLRGDLRAMMNKAVGNPRWNEKLQRHYTELPTDPRYAELANRIVSKLPPPYASMPMARAIAVKLYLDRTVTYTFKANHSGVDDPVAHYLFEDPRGYCVHQAHACVYLWRSLGLASRVGAGYATDARNRAGGSAILLRSGEAHAWPELYVDGVGWVIVDISPEKSDVGEMEEPDSALQRMLGEMARKKEKRDPDEPRLKNLREMIEKLLWAAWNFTKWGLLGGLLGLYGVKFYRRFEPLFCSSQRLGVAALRSGLLQLGEVNVYRRYGEGRAEFARRLGMEALEPLTYWHYAVSLGQPTEVPGKELLKQREKLHRQIARKYPLWLRLLGFLDPVSWLKVR